MAGQGGVIPPFKGMPERQQQQQQQQSLNKKN
jgi:hypothetical protein